MMIARFNFYPPCPRPDHMLGLKPHADGTAITFLLQDKEVEGLQILKDGQWFRVPIIPHALLINVGDQAEAINHGMESSFLDKVREIAKQFFLLPIEEKHKYSRTVEDLEGYGNDSVLSEHQILDWTDRLYLIVSPEDQRKLKFWPQNPECFREILHDYTTKLAMLNELVLKSMAKSLNLEENCFLNQYGERAMMFGRFNFYPPCPRPDRTLGLKPHADGSAITFLLQDKEVEGLQILKDGQWFRVPIIPHALLINVGDQAEIMSNGMFKSPVHRVVTNSERERITLAVFCMPESNNEIEPVEGLIDEKRPRWNNISTVKGNFDWLAVGCNCTEEERLGGVEEVVVKIGISGFWLVVDG
ncbi:Protein SRG1 [Camellia lanceoleosa]|uniref:Protein SRG1 n=1 Tax=Camellia lanceoleosa TaxID=1840588 RepID=A0ACC0FI30_9ERIC|nr:Protein SRG1 [Camellia lanceoleosa]